MTTTPTETTTFKFELTLQEIGVLDLVLLYGLRAINRTNQYSKKTSRDAEAVVRKIVQDRLES